MCLALYKLGGRAIASLDTDEGRTELSIERFDVVFIAVRKLSKLK